MTSTCPACKHPIEHDEFLFEVHCTCGSRFNPFDTGNTADEMGLQQHEEIGVGQLVSTQEFAESTSVFQELRDFGEGLGSTPAPAVPEVAVVPEPTAVPTPSSKDGTPLAVFFTSAQMLPGYQLVTFVAPISAWGILESTTPNPLRSAYEALAKQAEALGANAIVEVRWNPLPDGTKVIVSGSAVRCSKNSP